jgi:hypothetical protein
MANRTRSKKRSKNKKSKKMYIQRGGVFTNEEENTLTDLGFDENHINFLNDHNVSLQNIQDANQFVLNNNQHDIACVIARYLPNENNQNGMQQDLHIDDLQVDNQNGDLNINDLQGEGEGEGEGENNLNDAFIQQPELNNSGETDPEFGSFSFDDDDEDGDVNVELGLNDDHEHNQAAGKTRKIKTRKGRKGRKGKKSRKMRGGMRYGTGVGANCFDPNYSIYNTPALTLFPYKPN